MQKIISLLLISSLILIISCEPTEECKPCDRPVVYDQTYWIDENIEIGSIVDTIKHFYSEDQEIEFSIIEGNDGTFDIDSITGIITVLTNINYESNSEYSINYSLKNLETQETSVAKVKIIINDLEENSAIPINGMVAFYKFDNNLIDQSSFNYHASKYGCSYSPYSYQSSNTSISFDGTNDYIILPSTFDYQERTISFWFNANSFPIFNYDVNPNYSWGALISSDNPQLVFGSIKAAVSNVNGVNKIWVYKGGMDTKINPNILSMEVDKFTWYHLAITISQERIKVYIDGNLFGSHVTTTNHSVDGANNMIIGAGRHGDNRFFNGKIDDLIIYNRALSSEEVDLIYKE
ncbi:cadherin domain-containing protein [bacterium]|nr:cadherin domain-containing protein [bacterium]